MTSKNQFSSLAVLAAIACLAWWPARAAGEESRGEADPAYREAFVAGRAHFDSGEWAAARDAFQRAYDLQPTPLLLFNIASTYRREDQQAQALAMYRKFLAEAAEDDELRPLAANVIAEIEAELEQDRTPPAPAPPAPAPPAAPLINDAVSRPAPAPNAGRTLRLAGGGFAVAGGLLLGWGAFEAVRARGHADYVNDVPAGTPWSYELQDRYDQSQRGNVRATVAWFAGGAALATGVTLYLVGRRAKNRERLVVAPSLTPRQGQILVRGHF